MVVAAAAAVVVVEVAAGFAKGPGKGGVCVPALSLPAVSAYQGLDAFPKRMRDDLARRLQRHGFSFEAGCCS